MIRVLVSVVRMSGFTVTVSKPGYIAENVPVKTQVAGNGAAGFAGNVLFGGIVGMGTDAYTGATLEHVPNPVTVSLRPEPTPPAPVVKPRKSLKPAPQS